ncbi:MAG: DUF4344 domain-containing metallopeptidase [Hyphomicrobiaceae bacterium]
MRSRLVWLGPLAVLAALLLAEIATSARAQTAVSDRLTNESLVIDYVEPRDPAYLPVMQRLKDQQLLERLQQFLSPVRFKHKLRLTARQCTLDGSPNAFYYPLDWQLNICYEIVGFLDKMTPTEPVNGVPPKRVIMGALAGVILHEVGHALFDNLEVPVLGREEDAADQLAAFLALQFDKDVATTVVTGMAYAQLALKNVGMGVVTDRRSFSDEHGTADQRFYNLLCIAYGSDPGTFASAAAPDVLPPTRAESCKQEYAQIRDAFYKTIFPYIDPEKMALVQTVKWLPE